MNHGEQGAINKLKENRFFEECHKLKELKTRTGNIGWPSSSIMSFVP